MQCAELRHEEQFAVGGVEEAVGHALVGGVEVDGDAGVHGEVAVAGEGGEAVDEVGGLGGQRHRVPAELAGRGLHLVEGSGADHAVGDALVGLVHDGGADAVGPGAAVEVARRGEGGAAKAARCRGPAELSAGRSGHGQGAGLGLGGKLVAEAGEVLEDRRMMVLSGEGYVVLCTATAYLTSERAPSQGIYRYA